MGFYDGAKDKLQSKLQTLFENNEYAEEMEDDGGLAPEFQFTGDVDYTVKVEDEGDYREYYVSDGDGNIIEIFTDEMLDTDGRLPSTMRQEIAAQAQSDVGQELDDEESSIEGEIEDPEDVAEIEDPGEIEDPAEIEEMVVDPAACDAPVEGGSTETPNELNAQFATTEVAEDYAHNVRTIEDPANPEGI